jgi:sugar lactone lactonase YvrE
VIPLVRWCAIILVFLLRGSGGSAQTTAELLAARQEARAAVEAYRAQNWNAYESRLASALAVQPRHPIWLYNLASARALRGDDTGALALLDTIADLGFAFDAAADDDFARMSASSAFRERQLRLDANRNRVGAGTPIIQLPEPDFLPEGIAVDSAGTVYLSSVHQRRIVRVRDGRAETLTDSTAGLWGVFGIAYAPHTRSLWAVTAVTPVMAGYETGMKQMSALIEIDVASGKVIRRFDGPGDEHTFNDITVADSVVYVSDGRGAVHRWSESRGLTELVPPGVIYNPSGLVLMPGTEWLYVADYPVGITRVSVRTGRVERVREAAGISTYGVDGLMRHGRDLIAIQNALPPHRVTRLELDADGARIARLHVLERASPHYDEPTLGVIAGDALLYVANSRWGKFSDGRYTGGAGLAGPVVLRLPLEKR